uniref:BACK domain-containing protein n=1 Tax=Caenorhabditis tropicalis TaxID=1561998 RepID=A0A1I7V1F4_9PELO
MHRIVPIFGRLRPSAFLRQYTTLDDNLRINSKNDSEEANRLMERIVEDLKKSGTQFIIPGRDSFARQESAQVFEKLVKNGVKSEFLLDANAKNATLFRTIVSQPVVSFEVIETLVNVGYVTFEDAIRLLALFPADLLQHGATQIAKKIDALSACGISTPRAIASAIKRCPPLLFARDPQEMQRLAHEIGGFFSKRQAAHLISRCPQILLKPIEEIEEKYEYIFYQMGIESEDVAECVGWIDDLSLDDIVDRHKFLLATGKFATPDPKRPQIRLENPKLARILDSEEEDFATNVARVSMEEWVVYKALRVKETLNEKKERKFDRVKPSKRKAYERRHKERQELGEHIFDVSAVPN